MADENKVVAMVDENKAVATVNENKAVVAVETKAVVMTDVNSVVAAPAGDNKGVASMADENNVATNGTNGLPAPTGNSQEEREASLRDYLKEALAATKSETGLDVKDPKVVEEQRAKARQLMALREAGIDPNAFNEAEESVKEIKSIDSQLNRLNHGLDRIEKQSEEMDKKIKGILDSHEQTRTVRKTSMQQREEEYKKSQEEFDNNLANVMARVRASRGNVA